MYSPKHYIEERADLVHDVFNKFSFATLISVTNQGPVISHLPMLFDKTKNLFISHCARANPHWKLFSNNQPLTIIFNGPHSYISPEWYEPDPYNVPTWNYVTVHVTGFPKIIDNFNEAWLRMDRLVHHYEAQNGTKWNLPETPGDDLKNDVKNGIVVFDISIEKIEAKFKLSQKQDSTSRDNVIDHLAKSQNENSRLTAEYMKMVISHELNNQRIEK